MKTFLLAVLLGVFLFSSTTSSSDNEKNHFSMGTTQPLGGTTVFQFNSTWNEVNEYHWVETPKAKYFEVNLDQNPSAKQKYNIKSLPTIIIFKDGKEFKRYEGGLLMKITTPIQVIQKDL